MSPSLAASHADLRGHTIWIRGCIFSASRSHRSSSDRRLLTVIGCYLGGCQLKRQLSTFYASSVCLECQRSGAHNVWSALAGRLEFRVSFENKIRRRRYECVSADVSLMSVFIYGCLRVFCETICECVC